MENKFKNGDLVEIVGATELKGRRAIIVGLSTILPIVNGIWLIRTLDFSVWDTEVYPYTVVSMPESYLQRVSL